MTLSIKMDTNNLLKLRDQINYTLSESIRKTCWEYDNKAGSISAEIEIVNEDISNEQRDASVRR
jgi:hypothetical protein